MFNVDTLSFPQHIASNQFLPQRIANFDEVMKARLKFQRGCVILLTCVATGNAEW